MKLIETRGRKPLSKNTIKELQRMRIEGLRVKEIHDITKIAPSTIVKYTS